MNKVIIIFLLSITNLLHGQNEVSEKISESFNTENKSNLNNIAKQLNYKGGDKIKVFTSFTINEEGEITDIKARSVHPKFEQEAIRIISLLPKMPPAQLNGKPISRKYTLPIVFEVETKSEKQKRLRKEKRKKKKKKKLKANY